ncbi:MAG: hypothetical protein F4Z00_10270 [Acidimicrobiaceae bacterium]|nr:hypothetical protein [Acidimicrobiaceae bacterium]MCY3642538.1 hypothetical protein [Acidimicrobiaceae bacterium]MDE0494548.1 hypothetical protein [Acidimicrobiaceae bacterium]MXY09699.1 hypothetical protein [Acidimicrobiaceae bacterium]MXZ65922.1 hypothetical protein [Acidimicrobiaceae bacterium]
MGLLIVVGWISDNEAVRGNLLLWILLAAAVGLTFWECRERGYRPRAVVWWLTFVAITHVVGYIVLRFFVRPPAKS